VQICQQKNVLDNGKVWIVYVQMRLRHNVMNKRERNANKALRVAKSNRQNEGKKTQIYA
jgi:hypothetical protein